MPEDVGAAPVLVALGFCCASSPVAGQPILLFEPERCQTAAADGRAVVKRQHGRPIDRQAVTCDPGTSRAQRAVFLTDDHHERNAQCQERVDNGPMLAPPANCVRGGGWGLGRLRREPVHR